jgi:hypothetical protein
MLQKEFSRERLQKLISLLTWQDNPAVVSPQLVQFTTLLRRDVSGKVFSGMYRGQKVAIKVVDIDAATKEIIMHFLPLVTCVSTPNHLF